MVSDVAVEGGQKTVGLMRTAGGEAVFVRADVSQAAEVEALVRRAAETYGRVDCAFNNAGIVWVAVRTADYTQKDWDRVLAINLTASGCA